MVLSHLSHTEQEQLAAFLNSGQLGPVYVSCPQEDILAALGKPDFINIQYFGPVEADTLDLLSGGRTEDIRIDTFPDAEHDLLLEHYSYGRLQITLKDRLVSHYILTYTTHPDYQPAAHTGTWLECLADMTHQDIKTLFIELQLDRYIFYHEGYENEGPMLIRPDQDFDIDFVVGSQGPLDKVMVSGHRVRGIPTIQITLD